MPLRHFRTSCLAQARFPAAALTLALALGLLMLVPAAGPAHAQSYGSDTYRDGGYQDDGNQNDRYQDGGYQDDRYQDDGYDRSGEQADAGSEGYEDYDSEYRSGERRYGSEDRQRDEWDDYEDGEDVPDVGYFYDELSEDGRWVSHSRYGDVWVPRGVDEDWRPYTRGKWVNTEEHGWYWDSDEPFGWATYHYGRWHFDNRYGWVWVPGTRWGPAWVAWRESDDYVGWAPLPPDAYWEPNYGLRYDTAIYDSAAFSVYWSFITPALFTSPRIYRHCAPRYQTTNIIYRTRPHTNYVRANRRIVNRGVSITLIERATRTRLAAVRLNTTDNRQFRRGRAQNGNLINVYRPKLTRVTVPHAATPRSPAKVRRDVWDVDRMRLRPAKRAKSAPNAPRNAVPVARRPADEATRNPFNGAPPRGPSSYTNTPAAKARAVNPWHNLNTKETQKLKAIERARLNAARSKAARERTTANPAHRLPPPRQGNNPFTQAPNRSPKAAKATVPPKVTVAPPADLDEPPPPPQQPVGTAPVNKPKPANTVPDSRAGPVAPKKPKVQDRD